MKILKSIFCKLLIINYLIFFTCGNPNQAVEENNQLSLPKESKNPPKATSEQSQKWLVKTNNQEDFLTLNLSNREAVIQFDKSRETLTGEFTNADKVKYFNQQGDVIVEVKYKEEGFKIRNVDSKLLWKVKIDEDKIKISDNEENRNPFEIKKSESGKYKVQAPDKFLGEVKWKNKKVTAKGFQTFEIETESNSPAFAVLLINQIPENLRLIIFTELIRNREYQF